MINKRTTGSRYEELAAAFLEQKGYRILKRNFYCRQGELDLIALDGACLVFAEVKYRSSEAAGHPAEAVNQKKQHRMVQAARYFMYRYGYPEDTPCRFDVITVLGNRIEQYRDAFWSE